MLPVRRVPLSARGRARDDDLRGTVGAEVGVKPETDQQRKEAIRHAWLWSAISYIPLVAGIAWALFAMRHWAGSRGVFLGASGVMVGVAASSAIFFPVLKGLSPKLRLMGISLARYTQVSIVLAIAIAVVLAIAGVAVPEK